MKFHGGIPGWFNFADFYDWVVQNAPDKARFVEVGALFGASSVYLQSRIVASKKDIKLDIVDTFDDKNLSMESSNLAMPFGGFRKTFDFFTRGRLGDNVRVCQMPSREHAGACKPGSLHFVFLDGSHAKLDVLQDISSYLNAMAPGGILGGHDVDIPDVAQAVQEAFGTRFVRFGVSCWYVQL